jgi:acetyl-CoA carboxylase biotin carboxyl carrier protein
LNDFNNEATKSMPTPKAAAAIDTRLVRTLAEILNSTGLTEIEVERDGLKVRVAKTLAAAPTMIAQTPAPQVVSPQTAVVAAPNPAPTCAGEVVKSPMVGTVYLQPQPGAAPFARVGDTVNAGQTLLLVEAMKTMNPITAPKAGKIVEFLVIDAQPVEFGEPLVVIG